MRVGSLFSGIGGLDLGLERAGMEVVWQVEIDPFRRRVLARHWPDVERHDDVRGCSGHRAEPPQAGEQQLGPVDLICGGFPCQDLSVAGRRAGLRAPRSGLFFEFARIVGEVLPDWVLVENVPGLLSSNGGDDFRVVVDALQGLGYGLSWRILDSRHFGVPQRRRRVYVVGSLGGLRSAAVLFEPEGGAGDTPQGREAGEGAAHALIARTTATGRLDPNGEDFIAIEDIAGKQSGGAEVGKGWRDDGTMFSLQREHRHGVCAPPLRAGKNRTGGDRPPGTDVDTAASLICAPADADGVREATGVPRRVDTRAGEMQATGLTGRYRKGADSDATDTFVAAPLEAADGHHGRSSPRGDGADNLIAAPLRSRQSGEGVNPPGRGGEDDENIIGVLAQPTGQDGAEGIQGDAARPCCPDGPRYAALGDAVTVNVAEWIGRRIMMAGAVP